MIDFENDVFEGLKKSKKFTAVNKEAVKMDMPKTTPAKLKTKMYKVISKFNSIYKDNSWENVNKMIKELSAILPNLSVLDSKYSHNEEGVPSGKRWNLCGVIEDEKKKDKRWVVLIDIHAAGAGSVEDPLSKYDIIAVVNTLSPKKITDLDIKDYLTQYEVI